MNSFNGRSGFCCSPASVAMADADEDGFSGVLEIYAHHARNIHNICIYDKQDVYAKFSLTCSPDEALSTRIVNGGGSNPNFNESLRIKVAQTDAVLKCEIWMLSRARNHLEDQLLGFALVPVSSVAEKGEMTRDFALSSTDLFHSPAGTVRLTLALKKSPPSALPISSSITSEVVLLDPESSEGLDREDYEQIEFPDVNVAAENQQMVSEYFSSAYSENLRAPFLRLGASYQSVDDYDMNANSSEENLCGSISPNGSIQNSGLLSSTRSSLSDERNSNELAEKKNHAAGDYSNSQVQFLSVEAASQGSPGTPTSKNGHAARDNKDYDFSSKENECSKDRSHGSAKFGQLFASPRGSINTDAAEQSAMQQQIVDMYMKSMQQFTESLAQMKLPMDLDKKESGEGSIIVQQRDNTLGVEKKKDGSRVFYGSRAFF